MAHSTTSTWDEVNYRGKTAHHSTYQLDKNQLFLDLTAVAPPPCRDYFHLTVSPHTVVLTQLKISHGAHSTPIETRCDLNKILQNADLTCDIVRIFGEDSFDYIMGLSQGQYDWILTLPDPILTKIVFFAGIENMARVAPVCQRFATICESDLLWENFYRRHGGVQNKKTRLLQASLFSWKNIFLVNRVQDLVFPGRTFYFGSKFDEIALQKQLKGIKLVNERKAKELLQQAQAEKSKASANWKPKQRFAVEVLEVQPPNALMYSASKDDTSLTTMWTIMKKRETQEQLRKALGIKPDKIESLNSWNAIKGAGPKPKSKQRHSRRHK